MDIRTDLLLFRLLLGLLASNAQAQVMNGTNAGPIPDGTATGPDKYGAPRDLYFTSTSAGSVQNIDLVFQANHPFVGDLRAKLISPQGIEHVLFARTGATTPSGSGSSSNLVSTAAIGIRDSSLNNWWTLADIGDVNIPSSNARSVIAGPSTPPPPITSINDAFFNRAVRGTWSLRFEDGWSGDVGDVTFANVTITRLIAPATVTKVADTNDGVCDSDCSLREAIMAASPGNEVVFGSPAFDTPRMIFLNSQLTINKDLVITGPGAHRLTLSGLNNHRVFNLTGSRISLSGMRIADGSGTSVGCVSAQGGHLVLHKVEISNCRGGGAGGLHQTAGGSFLMSESSVSGNQALERGGGLVLESPARIIGSTISGNLTISPFSNTAGGIWASDALSVSDSTITNNIVRGGGSDQGAGISRPGLGLLSLNNSVVAGNVGGAADVTEFGGTLASGDHNAIGRVGTLAAIFNKPGDQIGVTELRLSVLNYHGGTVPVHVPLPGSPLLDKGKSFRIADVRGVPLKDLSESPAVGGNNADIGAIELSPILVSNLSFNDAGSLRQAFLNAPVAPAVSDIVFDPTLTTAPATMRFGTGLSVDRNVSIHGPGAQRLTLNGSRQTRVLSVQANRLVSVSGLTLADGNGSGSPNTSEGGVALNAEGSHLSVVDCVIQGGRSSESSAIKNRGALWLRGSTVHGNGIATLGGVITGGFNTSTIIETSTISGNRGIALNLTSATASVFRSTIHANAAASAIEGPLSSILVSDSIVAGQRSGTDLGIGAYHSGGHNFIGNPGIITAFNQAGDQVGSGACPLNPNLSPLAIYSGTVPVHVPLVSSLAIDGGVCRILDQRGTSRFDYATNAPAPGGDNSDIGAVEVQVLIVDTPGDAPGPGTLRQAFLNANANGAGVDDILVGIFGGTIFLDSTLPTLTGSTNLIGRNNSLVTISRSASAPNFGLMSALGPNQFGPQIQIGISGTNFTNGSNPTGVGGAISTNRAELHLSEVEVFNNLANQGGGVNIVDGNAIIQNSTFVGNSAGVGGALQVENISHRVRVEQSTFSNNTASFNRASLAAEGTPLNASGGAIDFGAAGINGLAELEVLSSTFAGNSASSGGGIHTATDNTSGGSVHSTTILRNNLFSANVGGNLVLNTDNGTGDVLTRGFNMSNTIEPFFTLSNDYPSANVALAPLANNGGPVRTHALLPTSAALDAGFATSFLFDPRGQSRPFDAPNIENGLASDGSDIGAYEELVVTIFSNGFE